jgi:glycosyltransferase involved in cell wall biosynthesis
VNWSSIENAAAGYNSATARSTNRRLNSTRRSMTKIAILYPSDPAGHAPSGIDSVIRGILKFAPPDLDYTLFGATTDPVARPVGQPATLTLGKRAVRFLPLIAMDSKARRSVVPVVVQYMRALKRYARSSDFQTFDILDFHRIEPVLLFTGDPRPKNVIVHQDMSVIREKNCDIKWRHAPWLYERIEHHLFSKMDRVFCVRQSAVARYQKIHPDLAARISFIPTWVDTEIYSYLHDPQQRSQARGEFRSSLGVDPDSCLLVYVGRLDRQKDPTLLVRAFHEASQRRSDLHLVIIGDGDLRPQVEAALKELNLVGRVHLLGVQPATQIVRALRACDLFVLSSAYEGMPIAVLEALATGLPVASTPVGEVPLVVHNGKTGELCTERTPAGLANAMSTALAQLAAMSGAPCEAAIAPYRPEMILHEIYDNHRRQAGAARTPR